MEICKTRTNTLIMKEELVNKFEEVIPSALQWIKDVDVEFVAVAKLRKQLEEAGDRLLELSKADKTTMARIQNMESLLKGKKEKMEYEIQKSRDMNKLVEDIECRLVNKRAVVQEDMRRKQEEVRTTREDVEKTDKLMELYVVEHEEIMKSLEAKRQSLEKNMRLLNESVLAHYSALL